MNQQWLFVDIENRVRANEKLAGAAATIERMRPRLRMGRCTERCRRAFGTRCVCTCGGIYHWREVQVRLPW